MALLACRNPAAQCPSPRAMHAQAHPHLHALLSSITPRCWTLCLMRWRPTRAWRRSTSRTLSRWAARWQPQGRPGSCSLDAIPFALIAPQLRATPRHSHSPLTPGPSHPLACPACAEHAGRSAGPAGGRAAPQARLGGQCGRELCHQPGGERVGGLQSLEGMRQWPAASHRADISMHVHGRLRTSVPHAHQHNIALQPPSPPLTPATIPPPCHPSQAWRRFAAALPETAVGHLFVSEQHLAGTDLKERMRDAIRANRK